MAIEQINWGFIGTIALSIITAAVSVGVFKMGAKLLIRYVKPKLSPSQWYAIVAATNVVYPIVERSARLTKWKGDDKLAQGLKQLAQYLQRDLSKEERRVARTVFASLAAADRVKKCGSAK